MHSFNHRYVLVAEDECLLALDLCDQLQETGARIIGPAPTVAIAIKLLDHPPWPDFAILDIDLGDGAVYPLAERLMVRGIPFVFASGVAREVIPEDFDEVPLLRKPLNLPQVDSRFWTSMPNVSGLAAGMSR